MSGDPVADFRAGLRRSREGSGLDRATLATRIDDPDEQARAHNGLAHIHHTTGHLDLTRHHWQQALALYIKLDIPDAQAIRAHLAALDQASTDNK